MVQKNLTAMTDQDRDEDLLCAICLEDVSLDNRVRVPGCRHLFCGSCLLNAAQYDVRCPVCRQMPTGVTAREKPTITTRLVVMSASAEEEEEEEATRRRNGELTIRGTAALRVLVPREGDQQEVAEEDEETAALEEARRQWRRYAARRRRILRRNPQWLAAHERLKTLQTEMRREMDLTQRLYDRKCREVWRYDSELSEQRKKLTRMRRRERTLERYLETAMQSAME